MVEVPDFLVPIEIAEKLKEIGFDKKVHFFFLYYQGWKILKKRDDKYGFITSDSCNPNVMFNYNLKENYLSVPTWNEVIEWFENLEHSIRIEIRMCENLENESDEVNSYIECIVITIKTKYKIKSCFVYNAKVYPVNSLEPIHYNYKSYTNNILTVAINQAINYCKNEKDTNKE